MGNILTSEPSVTNDLILSNKLREDANLLGDCAREKSQLSQTMWKLGDKSQAKQLSNEKQELYNQMNDKNRKAAELIFHFYNKNCPSSVIDLHGLRVDEALTFLSKKVHDCSANGNNQLTVITGIGNNSKEQTPRIKPEVIQFAQRNKITVVYTPNEGQLILELNAVQAERHMNETSCCTIL